MNRRTLLTNGLKAAAGLAAIPLALKADGFSGSEAITSSEADTSFAVFSRSFNGGPKQKFILENPGTAHSRVHGPLVTTLHPAIQANIDYWMKAAPEWLAECQPRHVSYYAVKERDELRVYAVKWNGADLNNHSAWVPANERDLIADATAAMTYPMGFPIGDVDGFAHSICSYVFNHPLHRRKMWGASISTSLLAAKEVHQIGASSRLPDAS